MIRALVWKELREQGVIVAALAVLGTGVLVAVGILNAANGASDIRSPLTDPGVLAVVALTVTAGSVVGGTLFATEKEMGTAAFLALLPVRRRVIWAGKILAGAGLVTGVVLVLFAAAAGAGAVGPPRFLTLWGVGLVVGGLGAFAWGSVGSVVARSSLAAAGLGAVLMAVAGVVIVPVLAVAWVALAPHLPREVRGSSELTVGAAVLFTLVVAPLALSLRLYTAPDRDRHRAATRERTPGKALRRRGAGFRFFPAFRAAVWMNVRQQRVAAAVMSGFGLLCGVSLLAPAAPFVAVWPPVAFFLAVLVGVLGWYDEQNNGAKRFWLERSLPTATLWWAKVVVGAFACGLMTLFALAPVAVKVLANRRSWEAAPSYLLTGDHFPAVEFVLLWPVYGFVAGHLGGLLFRKAVVAVAVAAMGGGAVAAVWLPSLLGGGLHPWQVWLPAAAGLAGARGLVWVAVAERFASRRGLGRLALAGGLVAVALTAGLGYRVVEIPDDPAGDADVAFERDKIPTFEADVARLKIRAAGVQLQEASFGRAESTSVAARRLMPTPARPFAERVPLSRLPERTRLILETAVEHGWQPTDAADWVLTHYLRTGWDQTLEESGGLPLGTVEDPRTLELNRPLEHLNALYAADTLLLVRGLKAQHDGDPERFVTDFALVLHLSRNVRNKSVSACGDAARRMEWRAMQALPRWLDQLDGPDALLAKVEAELARHDGLAGDDRADVRLADQVVLRNTLNAANKVLRSDWDYERITDADTRGRMDTEADLVGVAWQMPWEKERQRRLLAVGNGPGYAATVEGSPFHGMPAVGRWPHTQAEWRKAKAGGFATVENITQGERRAARLLVALRRYELKHARPPEALADLVPEFLPAVPTDPFSKQPFRYRLSAGETITVETRTERPGRWAQSEQMLAVAAAAGGVVGVDPLFGFASRMPQGASFTEEVLVPAGRPILWGVGPDAADHGGTTTSTFPDARLMDRVYWLK